MPSLSTASGSGFWLSPEMPCSSASTSSCDRTCWFTGNLRGRRRQASSSLDDEVGEVHGADRRLVFGGAVVGRGVGLGVDGVAQRLDRGGADLAGQLHLALV